MLRPKRVQNSCRNSSKVKHTNRKCSDDSQQDKLASTADRWTKKKQLHFWWSRSVGSCRATKGLCICNQQSRINSELLLESEQNRQDQIRISSFDQSHTSDTNPLRPGWTSAIIGVHVPDSIWTEVAATFLHNDHIHQLLRGALLLL